MSGRLRLNLSAILALMASGACTALPPPPYYVPAAPTVGAPPTTSFLPTPAPASQVPTPTMLSGVSSPQEQALDTTVSDFCSDTRASALISKFKQAVVDSDGQLLASIIDPDSGMDVRLFRDGRVINYDREHAAAVLEFEYQANWGNAPGSGLPAIGSFRDLVIPDLMNVLNAEFATGCNAILAGGATYPLQWPYPGEDFYSLYSRGSDVYGGLDWHTLLLGVSYVRGAPYIRAIMQLKWEP